MGRIFQAICVKCNNLFEVRKGDGKNFHVLHCCRCGREKLVRTDESRGQSLYPLNKMEAKAGISTPENEYLGEGFCGSAVLINERENRLMIEHRAGLCVCGSVFKISGKIRCPRCRSTVFKKNPSYGEITYA